MLPGHLDWERERLSLNGYEDGTQGPDVSIEVRGFRLLEVLEKTSDPRRQVVFEQLPVSARGSDDLATRQASHDLQKDCGMILRLREGFSPLDAYPTQ